MDNNRWKWSEKWGESGEDIIEAFWATFLSLRLTGVIVSHILTVKIGLHTSKFHKLPIFPAFSQEIVRPFNMVQQKHTPRARLRKIPSNQPTRCRNAQHLAAHLVYPPCRIGLGVQCVHPSPWWAALWRQLPKNMAAHHILSCKRLGCRFDEAKGV
jgi:hypothetical protein